MKTKRTTSLGMPVACLVAGAGLLCGCRGDREDAPPRQFFPDLDDAPKWKPQTQSEFFTDGRTMRQPPAGVVPFGRQRFLSDEPWAAPWMQARAELLKDDAVFTTGKNPDGSYVVKAPVQFTIADVKRGQERFNIYCAVCHNYTGDGKGMVGIQFMAGTAANFHEAKYNGLDPADPTSQKHHDGFLFFTARNGVPGGSAEQPDWIKNKMPGYAHALSVDDTWRVVAYVRSLQAHHKGTLEDVPEAERPNIKDQASTAPAPAAPQGGGS